MLQGVEATYETDLFMPIIERTQELTGHSDAERDANIVPYRVIADHIRAAVFLISDGVMPGAKGPRRHPPHRHSARRALRPRDRLRPPFPGRISPIPSSTSWASTTRTGRQAPLSIKRIITQEEERFHRTMDRG